MGPSVVAALLDPDTSHSRHPCIPTYPTNLALLRTSSWKLLVCSESTAFISLSVEELSKVGQVKKAEKRSIAPCRWSHLT